MPQENQQLGTFGGNGMAKGGVFWRHYSFSLKDVCFPSYAAGCAAIEDRNAEESPRDYTRAARDAVAGRFRIWYPHFT